MTPADKPDLPALMRSIQTWARCDPAAMADQSKAAIYFAFQDLLSDVQTLARAVASSRRKALEEAARECMLRGHDFGKEVDVFTVSDMRFAMYAQADRIYGLIDKELTK